MESPKHAGKRPPERFEFAGIVFDSSSGELWRGAERLRLRRQPALLLALLIARHGEVVLREEIRHAIWGSDTHVDFEQGINWCVRQLRKALNDDAEEPRFIETLAKQGYRFVPPCSVAAAASAPRRTSFFRRKTAVGALA